MPESDAGRGHGVRAWDSRDQRAAHTLVTLGIVADEEALLQALNSATWSDALAAVGLEGEAAAQALGVVESVKAPLADEQVTRVVAGRYEALAELGEGGMGRVTLASDAHLHRQVALKELLVQHPAMELRFLREARVTAQLEHPGIVPVYELGRNPDGTLFYTMKEVRGHTLREALDACTTLDERLTHLGVLVDVCQALGYAHSKGVVHRDLKPENVMIGAFGETTVLDWGLAKVANEPDLDLPVGAFVGSGTGSDLTRAGTVMGTPRYMSPEQAAGRLEQVDARSDVWAIGVILYELLTGDAPFQGTTASVLEQIQHGDWMAPDALERGLPPALVAICTKALSRDPDERYPEAGAVARELEAWRNGAVVLAHSYGAVERVQRAAGRFRVVLVGVGALAIGGTAGWMAREREVEALEQADTQAEQTARIGTQLLRAEALARAGSEPGALVLARDAMRIPGPHQEHAKALAEAMRPSGDVRVLTEGFGYRLTWTPSGTRLAWAAQDGVVIADPVSGSELGRLPTDGVAAAFALTPDEGRIWIQHQREVVGTDLSDLSEVGRFEVEDRFSALHADADGLLGRTEEGWIRWTFAGERLGPAPAPELPTPPRVTRRNNRIVVGEKDLPMPFSPRSVLPSPDGGTLAVGGEGGVWVWSLEPTTGFLTNLRVCPDGNVVAVLPFPREDDLDPPARACSR